jgi:hypothetical protein
MGFWNFKVKSDTLRVDSTGRARVDLNSLFSKDHVKRSLSSLRQQAGRVNTQERAPEGESTLARSKA